MTSYTISETKRISETEVEIIGEVPTDALASALEKISSDPTPIRVANNTTAHLWFDDPFDYQGKKKQGTPWFHKIFMTHPPVEERLQALRGMKIS